MIDPNDIRAGSRVNNADGKFVGTLTGDQLASSNGRLLVVVSDNGVYGFVPEGTLRDEYDLAVDTGAERARLEAELAALPAEDDTPAEGEA